MQQHPESEQVALHGLKILSALAFHDETVGAVATVQSICTFTIFSTLADVAEIPDRFRHPC